MQTTQNGTERLKGFEEATLRAMRDGNSYASNWGQIGRSLFSVDGTVKPFGGPPRIDFYVKGKRVTRERAYMLAGVHGEGEGNGV